MSEKAAPDGSCTTADRPYGESCAGISTVPPPSVTVATAASVSATEKHVDQPGGMASLTPPSPPSGRSSVPKVV